MVTLSPALSSWGGGTEGNNYRLVITSSLNGFSLISHGFTSNLKVITCNLYGFLLWGRRRSSGGACRGEVSPLSARAMKNSHVHSPARTIEPFPAARKGPGHTQQPPPCLMTSTIQGKLRWPLHGGMQYLWSPSGSNTNTQIWLFQGYFTAELVKFRGTECESDQIGQKDMNYITQRSSENPAPEHRGWGTRFLMGSSNAFKLLVI